jgi:hypothetical protein
MGLPSLRLVRAHFVLRVYCAAWVRVYAERGGRILPILMMRGISKLK